jgi:preprotein translocase SecE subunit
VSQSADTTFAADLASSRLYKWAQGRLARRLTGIAVAAIAILGAWSLQTTFLLDQTDAIRYGVPGVIGVAGLWLGFRIINHARFAEFLISTESEVEKVHWPDRAHVHRATVVVVVTMLLMGGFLFVCDMVWQYVFSLIGFLEFQG